MPTANSLSPPPNQPTGPANIPRSNTSEQHIWKTWKFVLWVVNEQIANIQQPEKLVLEFSEPGIQGCQGISK